MQCVVGNGRRTVPCRDARPLPMGALSASRNAAASGTGRSRQSIPSIHGKPLPPSMTKDLNFVFIKPSASVVASPRLFKPFGKSGTEFSDFIPHIASCADICASFGRCSQKRSTITLGSPC